MIVENGKIIAYDGRILLSRVNVFSYELNVWDRLYKGSLETHLLTLSQLQKWNDPNSPLYDYFMRVGGGVTFLEVDDILEGFKDA